jgi:Domain of unknown function (DUF397)
MSTDAKARTLKWRKASYSAGNGACIEVAPDKGQIAVRDSRKPDGAWLHYSASSWHSFIRTIKGE